MAPSPLAFAATLAGHVLVQKTAFLCQGEPAARVCSAERDTTALLDFCWVSSSLLAMGRSGGLQ